MSSSAAELISPDNLEHWMAKGEYTQVNANVNITRDQVHLQAAQ